MKIKRFFAADIRQAMRMVKEELGADAVIMSNRSVDGGVEIVAARDFDEQVIHKNLEQGDPQTITAPKKVELPNLTTENKPAHILSSARKRGNEPETPVRRSHVDQYLGYAEKVQLGGSASAQKIADKIKHIDKPVSRPQPEVSKAPVAAQSEKFLDEMRKEMKELRAMLDAKLSAIPSLPLHGEQPIREQLLNKLAACGVSKVLSNKIANRLGSHKQFEVAFSKAQEMLARIVPIADDDLLENGGIAALVGSTGVGKTTTIAKLAAQFMLKHGSRDIALITTDNYRIGAHEQINIYGKILDIPVRVAADAEELRSHINSFSDKRLILIDTAGMSQRDMRLAEQIKTLQQDDLPIKTYLVMSATTQYKAVHEIMDAFQILEPQATILTKLDEAVSKTTALSAIIERRMPLSFVTDGQQVPEDIYTPDADALVKLCMADVEDDEAHYEQVVAANWLAESHA